MKIAIVMPAYNEEKRIGSTLESYSKYFEGARKKDKFDYEILVSINNTTDKTEEIVKTFSKKNKRIRYINLPKGGKGYAVIEGFKEILKGDSNLIGFVDADNATPPESFHDLIKNINGYGGVIASRYINGSKVNPKPTPARILVSRIYNSFIRIMFFVPYRDTQCGAKLFTRNAIEKIIKNLSMSQWAFDLEIIYNLRKSDFKIKEIPTVWSDKKYSKINFMKAGPIMALALVRLRILNSPFKKIVKVYDMIFGKKS